VVHGIADFDMDRSVFGVVPEVIEAIKRPRPER
jgi:hypothetical protein